ncbi:GNAT family N-acetyltransferase [Streptomyces rhizosphaericus]|uniref:GNAT family N-acetyltransferase n=1 Tax=Streptomyces rhizosphaericus TaxID=114699 RepID=UPI00142E4516|nr:GNAT family N-acetyltransferase [Streptomyces rhizosphaericus]
MSTQPNRVQLRVLATIADGSVRQVAAVPHPVRIVSPDGEIPAPTVNRLVREKWANINASRTLNEGQAVEITALGMSFLLSFHTTAADDQGHARVEALVPGGPYGSHVAGFIVWHPKRGEVQYVHTDPSMRGRGIATTLWKAAHDFAEQNGLAAPRHSEKQTKAGAAWAQRGAADGDGPTGDQVLANALRAAIRYGDVDVVLWDDEVEITGHDDTVLGSIKGRRFTGSDELARFLGIDADAIDDAR